MNPTTDILIEQIGQIVLGKEQQIRLALACLLAQGHLLIEDLPGMGKTTLAHCLARIMGLEYSRVQFTSDLLPSDILGMSVFDREAGRFVFHEGPVFTQILLADEINRSTPKTQSALLEAMEEGQVTIDGETRNLQKPFFVIATQNPAHQSGTFPLPESQLDRFLMRITLGYPSAEAERFLLKGEDSRARLKHVKAVLNAEQLLLLQHKVEKVKVSDAAIDYLQKLVNRTRNDARISYGVSPRGALGWLKASKAWAFLSGREYVLPDDIQAVMPSVVGHRIKGEGKVEALLEYLLNSVDVVN